MASRDDEVLGLIRDLARLMRGVRKSSLDGKESDWHLKVCEIEVKASEMIGARPKMENM
jgi:hypothetical protein